MIDQERELREEIKEDARRQVQNQRAENEMAKHWERAYGDE